MVLYGLEVDPHRAGTKDEATGKYVLVPIDDAAIQRDIDRGIIVKGNFDAFKSPIDGSVISNQREYEDHCQKHNVVDSREFSAEWYAKKKAERERLFSGERTKEQELRDKQFINEQINRYR